MREPPAIPSEHIAETLREAYGLDVVRLEFLPLGYDSSAAVYKATTEDGRDYFAKLKLNGVYDLSVAVPRFIRAAGVPEAIAPLPAADGSPWGTVDGAALLLYPFVAGEQGSQVEWHDTMWTAYGDVMRRIHAAQPTDALTAMLPREDFVPNQQWHGVIKQLSAEIAVNAYDDPFSRELASFWRERQAQIDGIVERAEALGRRLQAQPPPFVLCHADLHRNNLLITPEGALHVVDWDQPMFAPRERDLMFALAGVADGKTAN
jgi:spectinomycin phosphotransferase